MPPSVGCLWEAGHTCSSCLEAKQGSSKDTPHLHIDSRPTSLQLEAASSSPRPNISHAKYSCSRLPRAQFDGGAALSGLTLPRLVTGKAGNCTNFPLSQTLSGSGGKNKAPAYGESSGFELKTWGLYSFCVVRWIKAAWVIPSIVCRCFFSDHGRNRPTSFVKPACAPQVLVVPCLGMALLGRDVSRIGLLMLFKDLCLHPKQRPMFSLFYAGRLHRAIDSDSTHPMSAEGWFRCQEFTLCHSMQRARQSTISGIRTAPQRERTLERHRRRPPDESRRPQRAPLSTRPFTLTARSTECRHTNCLGRRGNPPATWQTQGCVLFNQKGQCYEP